MAIFVDKKTALVVQGITGRDGSLHAQLMKEYGTKVVAGVTPGKGGTKVHGIPVFNTMADAVTKTKANTSAVFVPPKFAVDAIYEAVDAGIKLVVCITEGIPANDMTRVVQYVSAHGARLIGGNCPGLISPGTSKVGIMPGSIVKKGNVGVVSRSGTLTYEAIWALTQANMGQSSCVGIGGDPVNGTGFIDCLEAFEADSQTKSIVMIGEIGGTDEEKAAAFIKKRVSKPVVSFIAGQTAPPGKRMGHAGAIISGGSGTAEEKIRALNAAGVPVAGSPTELPELLTTQIKKLKEKAAKKAARQAATATKKTSAKTTKAVAKKAAKKSKPAKKAASKRR